MVPVKVSVPSPPLALVPKDGESAAEKIARAEATREWLLQQRREARARLEKQTRDLSALYPEDFFRFPWVTLDAAVGGLRPGTLAMLCAPPEGGKTSFLISLLDALVRTTRQRVLFAGLETPPADLIQQMAAIRAGLPPEWFSTGTVWKQDDPFAARDALDVATTTVFRDMDGRVTFSEETTLSAKAVKRLAQQAHEERFDLVVIDHLDHVAAGPYGKTPQDHSIVLETLAAAKVWLKDSGAPTRWLCASQLNNDSARRGILGRAAPPLASDVYMGGRKEQLADVMLGLHRVRRPPTDDDKAIERDIKLGLRPIADLLLPNVMGVRIMKKRGGGSSGMTVRLPFARGAVQDQLLSAVRQHEVVVDTLEPL